MDFRPQQPGEHDFTYAARILHACGTKFEAMLANGSYSLDDLRDVKEKIKEVVDKELTPYIPWEPEKRRG